MAGTPKTFSSLFQSIQNPRIFLSWLSLHQAQLNIVFSLLFLSFSAWLVGSLIWLPLTNTTPIMWRATADDAVVGGQHEIDVALIKQRNLFGAYQAQPQQESRPVVQNAPKTRLNLSLVGVVAVEPQQNSLAIIANRGQQQTYGIGEAIEGTRAHLITVMPDHVVIDNAGRRETLMLEDALSTPSSTSRANAQSQANPAAVESDELAQIRQRIAENPTQLFQYVQLSAYNPNGEMLGYRLRPGRAKALFDSAGLQEGDIAIEMNGVDLKQSDALEKLMPMLNDLSEVNLTVERDGQPYEIYIQL